MSFWDVVISICAGLVNQTQKAEAEYTKKIEKREANIQRYEDRYADLDREELIRRYQNTTGDSKIAASRLLKNQTTNRK